ncbi:hypothetical protein [Parapedobacter soli]|uniref:hypothetical protein n=1 Tax=Parapedobacter soli TaxID=416955 RepID=UPI0021C9ACB9|nr:hypothetical protein [Parapedobacter soli]
MAQPIVRLFLVDPEGLAVSLSPMLMATAIFSGGVKATASHSLCSFLFVVFHLC